MISVLYSQTVLITVYGGVKIHEVTQNSRNHVDLWPLKNCHGHGTAQLFLKLLLITEHEVPFINTSEATKGSSNWTENGKCTDVTNCRSRVGLSTSIYTNHRYNHKTPDLFWWVFSLSHIFTDLIMHNYRSNQSNQSALMTRCGPGQIFVISMEFSVVNRRRPSRETSLGPGVKKDGCFRRLSLFKRLIPSCVH